jgi:aspartate dehydrogenase
LPTIPSPYTVATGVFLFAILFQSQYLTNILYSSNMSSSTTTRIGIVGYGALGQYLTHFILSEEGQSAGLELAFVWNRTPQKVLDDPDARVQAALLTDLNDFATKSPTMIVEVAHPSITVDYGTAFISKGADYFCGSPTVFANLSVEESMRQVANAGPTSLYLPAGALWGSNDIQKMAARHTLKGLTITMKKAPHHMKVLGSVKEAVEKVLASGEAGEHVVYEGPVRGLCPLAPNNVNTMACAAMAAGPELGFDGTNAKLIVDKDLTAHVVIVQIEGPGGFTLESTRYNPAKKGAVTGNATYASFLSSMLAASLHSKSGVGGVHIV